jgi:hypothetical protein
VLPDLADSTSHKGEILMKKISCWFKKHPAIALLPVLVISALLLTAAAPATGNACPKPGTCDPVYEWQDVPKVQTGYTCSPGWTLDGDKCTKPGHSPKDATPVYGCPPGSDPYDGGKCRVKVQTGWDCNCGEGQEPDGEGHCVNKPTATPVPPTPTEEPTVVPTEEPTVVPTEEPTVAPTEEPTVAPTEEPTTPPEATQTLVPTSPQPPSGGGGGGTSTGAGPNTSPWGAIALTILGLGSIFGLVFEDKLVAIGKKAITQIRGK